MNKAAIARQESAPGKNWFRYAALPLLIVGAVTLIAFVNAWPNSLVLDDPNFAGPQRPPELDNLLYIFTHDVWSAKGIDSAFYRPLLLLCLSVESWLFGDWLAGYHLSNIFHHLFASLLVYGFLRYLLETRSGQGPYSDLYALLATLVFVVHPIHTEAVNSVFNRSDIMVAIFGLGGLWWLLQQLDSHAARAWSGLAVTYFLAMLSKENAVVIPGVAVVFVLLLTPGGWIAKIRKCLPVFWLLLPLVAYLAMRAYALGQPEVAPAPSSADSGENLNLLEGLGLPTSRKLIAVADVLNLALKLMLWPHPLLLYQDSSESSGLVLGLILELLLLATAAIQFWRKQYGLAAGLAFFYLALLPSSRLFGGLGESAHLAERYLYFPSAGLAMMLAFGFRAAAKRFGARLVLNTMLPALLVLTVLTWDRNAEWASDRKLYETEYKRGHHGHHILRLLTSIYVREHDYANAARVCDENWDTQATTRNTSFPYYCSIAYEHQNRIEAAERVYRLQIEFPRTRVLASRAFAKFYVRQNRPKDALKHFINAINWSEDPAIKAFYTAEMMLALNPGNRKQLELARSQIQEALRLRPDWDEAEEKLREVNRILD